MASYRAVLRKLAQEVSRRIVGRLPYLARELAIGFDRTLDRRVIAMGVKQETEDLLAYFGQRVGTRHDATFSCRGTRSRF